MDSLLASYASSDEEDELKQPQTSNPAPNSQSKSGTNALFSSLPPPISSSSLFSLPPPKSHFPNPSSIDEDGRQSLNNGEAPIPSASIPKPSASLFSSLPQPKSSSSSSLFSSLPPPKFHDSDGGVVPSPVAPPKKVVQFRPPPVNLSSLAGGDDEESDEDEEDKRRKKQNTVETASVKSFLSSIPAPRNSSTLGVSSLGSGTGRRSIIDADVQGLKNSNVASTDNQGYLKGQHSVDQSSISSSGGVGQSSEYAAAGGSGDYPAADVGGEYANWGAGTDEKYAAYGGYAGYVEGSGDYQTGGYVNYSSDYGNYADYGQYQSNQVQESSTSFVPEMSGIAGSAFKVPGKRGRNYVPEEIIEVKQDELMKNRPREDQVKVTGIAFGPSHQPASTKGKPSKLHKRKHQITSLLFDMKQKETELAERRARGFLTKAQTQGKYGW
ncbi:OLC1v1006592C1 [Oldenlandia corymbosa var. corymbosa]|uniref:OLC1v1006592C1 n=1 Tax=Oldenlandia corymbosa var. corymbosa TaxID=529605 RepID=A0AAV1DHX1_OLDCO|nr:OLC1v1006592C1 [Oldenlandia corymbosa var. corymbosa]